MVSSFKAHEIIGQNVRKRRQKLGMTQERLAEKADLHPVYISQIERAERAVTIDALLRLAKALGVKLRDLVAGL